VSLIFAVSNTGNDHSNAQVSKFLDLYQKYEMAGDRKNMWSRLEEAMNRPKKDIDRLRAMCFGKKLKQEQIDEVVIIRTDFRILILHC
jgi:hypothetical protein